MSTRRYAEDTPVTARQSRDEIERTVERYGGVRFSFTNDPRLPHISFEMEGRSVQIVLPLPVDDGTRSKTALDKEVRRRWRALALVVNARLEAVVSEIATFDESFLPDIVVRGQRAATTFAPQIAEAYRTPTPLLPPPRDP